MGTIVTTLLYLPLGVLAATLAFAAFDVPLHSLVTFGGSMNMLAGLALWWAIAFVPAVVYTAVCVAE